MPQSIDADTITILIATDNHVGYNERHAIRGMDSHRTFREIMNLAKEREVDMVLLAGDLFHDNKPSRKSMCSVMESLRTNCLGDRPCELEMLSDGSEHFPTSFNHVNYEDQDINVAIPVFSIHGNHDDPTGEGNYSALDLLHMSGLLNYYGKMSEADKIDVKPILLQKGHTKLALYGMSNVRDERLFRTFKLQNVTFYQPGVQTGDWFNLMSVHQNHHAHTESGHLPEKFIPQFMDLVVWGHEHECLIEPRYNAEQGFHVMQPGSSVATSLMPGEAVPKHVAILKVTGKEFKVEPILLKSVRPFIMKEIVLAEEPALKNLWKKDNNRTEITRHLIKIVEELIDEAKQQWRDVQVGEIIGEEPLPLIRLRVEYSAPDGGRFDCENPQRFSNRFNEKVANESDVVQFYRKKTTRPRQSREDPEMPEESVLEQLNLDSVKVEKLVREFLNAQSLTVLPQEKFGKAVGEFVDKDDKHSVDAFLLENLKTGINFMLKQQHDEDGSDNEDVAAEKLAKTQSHLAGLSEDAHKKARKLKSKPKPEHWDTDLDGEWEDQPAAYIPSDLDEDAASIVSEAPAKTAYARGRGRTRGGRTAATGTTRKAAAAPKKAAPVARAGRGKKKVVEEEEDEDDSDVQMISNHEDDDDNDEEDDLFVKPTKATAKKPAAKVITRQTASTRKTTAPKQSTLNFSQATQRAPPSSGRKTKPIEISDDEISDDDAFDPPPTIRSSARSRR